MVELPGRLVSLQVGRPALLPWRGKRVRTAIGKGPVPGPLRLSRSGFAGDEQADLELHGGPDKAACAYPTEHVPGWEERLGTRLPPGAFGENLSTAGLLETEVHIGDVMELGTALVQVSQPRGPCFKLAARWGHRELPGEMARAGLSGFYFRVLEDGTVSPGDPLHLRERHSDVSVAEVMRVTYRDRHDHEAVERLLATPELADQWRHALVKLAARNTLPLDELGTSG